MDKVAHVAAAGFLSRYLNVLLFIIAVGWRKVKKESPQRWKLHSADEWWRTRLFYNIASASIALLTDDEFEMEIVPQA